MLETVDPDEVYKLGAQSHVKVSFDIPEFTAVVAIARREFLHVDDLADAVVFLMKTWSDEEPISMGTDITTAQLASGTHRQMTPVAPYSSAWSDARFLGYHEEVRGCRALEVYH